ncbi:hypothetical protein [Idiomarina sp. HP20-50]|uniref:hypothetical protein n=1 Tax=Idiomarina sp. HP20-50 TaxID=3070813 RepID=UPI00294B27D5|nr:hypothetical protein [Idiomarina sp. HP20-50]MDV6316268.1 hypothetical protein [Idiomarina sp. HP20-50]
MTLENTSFCRESIIKIIKDFETLPSSETFFDLGTVLEVLILSKRKASIPEITDLATNAALKCLRNGLIENALYSSMDNTYHCALFCHFASMDAEFTAIDMQVIDSLLSKGLIARNELPVISQYSIKFHFSCAGSKSSTTALERRNLLTMIDKRLLRTRTDEYDLVVLIMLAQCSELLVDTLPDGFGKLNQVLLAQAIRSSDINRVSVLLLVGCFLGVLPSYLRKSSESFLTLNNPNNKLMPLPTSGKIDNEYIKRASKGLKLRGAVAQAIYFSL